MSRRRGRRRRQKKREPRPLHIGERGRFSLKLHAVEINRGHDGYLRGVPEPALMLAAFGIAPARTVLLERALRRLTVTEPFPSEGEVEQPLLFRCELPARYPRIALLGLALEQDSGKEVQTIYAALDRCATLSLWSTGSALPEPRTLEDLASQPATAPPEASPVQLMREGVDLADACRHDDWIGAALVLLSTDQPSQRRWRLPFRSADGRNDWTVKLRLAG